MGKYCISKDADKKNIIIARVNPIKRENKLITAEIEKIFYLKGYKDWRAGLKLVMHPREFKKPKEVVEYIFEEL